MEFNKTAKSIIDTIIYIFSIFTGKGIQSIGSWMLGYIFWFMAFIILIWYFTSNTICNNDGNKFAVENGSFTNSEHYNQFILNMNAQSKINLFKKRTSIDNDVLRS